MARYQYIVLTSAAPGRLEDFESWYDNQHLKDVVAVPGVLSARRYRVLSGIDNGARRAQAATWDCLAVYELETEDPIALTLRFAELAGTPAMPLCDAISGHLALVGELASEA